MADAIDDDGDEKEVKPPETLTAKEDADGVIRVTTKPPEEKTKPKINPFVDSLDTLSISCARVRRPVKVTDFNGKVHNMFLQEMSGVEQDQYVTKLDKLLIKDADGKPVEWESVAKVHVALLTLTLYEIPDDGSEPAQVSEEELMKWPRNVRAALHAAAEKLCNLDPLAEARIKNV